MSATMNNPLIPQNKKGKALDLEHEITCDGETAAKELYKNACARLLQPALWHKIAGVASASFLLAERETGTASVHDHIQIDIPGPGSSAGEGFDWVQVESIDADVDSAAHESLGMTLRACENPRKATGGVAHFFTADATSTFIISRTGYTVRATYSGRNEVPNVGEVGLPDKVRNGVIATGAMAGLSALQWQAFIKGLLEREAG